MKAKNSSSKINASATGITTSKVDNDKVSDLNLDKLFVRTAEGIQIPVSEVASIELVNGPLQINRDATKRRIVIGVNVRDADIQQVVSQIQDTLEKNIKLKPGYYFEYGGQFENLQNAINTLLVVIPVALGPVRNTGRNKCGHPRAIIRFVLIVYLFLLRKSLK